MVAGLEEGACCYLTSGARARLQLPHAKNAVIGVVAIVVVRVPVGEVDDPRIVSIVGHRRRGPHKPLPNQCFPTLHE